MVDNTQAPVPTNGARLMPSSSTVIGGLGGAGLAPLVILTAAHFGIPLDAGSAAAIGSLIGNALGYFFEGGRKRIPMQ